MTGAQVPGAQPPSGTEAQGAPPVTGTEAAGEQMRTSAHDVLMVIDVQRDFCPGGALGVADGDQVVPIINSLVPKFHRWVYTRDWHPHDHVSFSAEPEGRDGSWPPHAVQGTAGAGWCDGLAVPADAVVVSKGDDPHLEEYSAFAKRRLDLAQFLRLRRVDRVFIAGLATDYCVQNTAIDACEEGFTVYVIEDAVRGVSPETTETAIARMGEAGVVFIRSEQVQHGD
jgi:nicotinamidase/pyrazinamidase